MTAVTAGSVVGFALNGSPIEVVAPGGRRLLDVLRADLGLTGTKEGCGEGECGACAVLVDGVLVNSCLVPVCQIEGHAVTTVEGLAHGDRLDPLQDAFLRTGAVQCGMCTPGMLMAGRAFLGSGAAPTDEAIRESIAGNLCRCTGYTRIVEAIRAAATASEGAIGNRPAPPLVALVAGPPGVVPRHAPAAISPRTLDDALRILAKEPCRPVAGATDVMVELAREDGGLPLLDLWSIDELRGIRLDSAGAGPPILALGALTTYADLRRSPLVAEHLPALAEAAGTVGAAQIQARGTIGGNIANASPAGDMLPALLATDATIVVASVRGEHAIPATSFFTAYRQTARAADELLVRVEIPLPPGRRLRFRKVGARRAQAISKVVIAVSWRDDARVWRDVHVALGSVAPVPIRVPRTEATLEGSRPTEEIATIAARIVASEITPIDDVRSTAAYRRAVSGRILRRIVLDAVADG